MRNLLLAGLFGLASLSAHGQNVRGKSIPVYVTKLGTSIHAGDTLQLGPGTRPDGGFKYAAIPPNILTPAGMPVPAYWGGKKIVVRDIKEVQAGKGSLNRDVSIVFKSGVYNATLDADQAEANGELVTQAGQRKATPTTGVADELLKLKSLLDAGALTQAEYDAQKAKLLAR